MSFRKAATASLFLALGCGHSETFTPSVPTNGPFNSSSSVPLTFNADQDYWPTWTSDAKGILYAFVDPNDPQHRCIGLLPAAGGSRVWQLCHVGVRYQDSVSSFTGYALDATGRLLYVEAASRFVPGIPSPDQGEVAEATMWLADTATPFQRTLLLSLPLLADGVSVGWLSELHWTGANTFVALGQSYALVRHCFGIGDPPDPACEASDTVWSTGGPTLDAGAVMRGTIANGHATLSLIAGTNGATGYSLAENGASVVFTQRDDGSLYKVPIAGGVAVNVGYAPSPLRPGYQVFGVGCRGSACIVATDSATLTRLEPSKIFPLFRGGTRELRSFSLSSGTSAPLSTYDGIIASIAASPLTGDVVVQVGGMWGHLQTMEGSVPSDLYLLRGILQ
jgi:hypothetical protein